MRLMLGRVRPITTHSAPAFSRHRMSVMSITPVLLPVCRGDRTDLYLDLSASRRAWQPISSVRRWAAFWWWVSAFARFWASLRALAKRPSMRFFWGGRATGLLHCVTSGGGLDAPGPCRYLGDRVPSDTLGDALTPASRSVVRVSGRTGDQLLSSPPRSPDSRRRGPK